jgi:hypothetical protein
MKPPQHSTGDCTGRWERVGAWMVCRGCKAGFLTTAGVARRGWRENSVGELLKQLTREGVRLRGD